MTPHDRELLRPEDATSLEEFQARRAVEQAQIRGMNSSWKRLGAITRSARPTAGVEVVTDPTVHDRVRRDRDPAHLGDRTDAYQFFGFDERPVRDSRGAHHATSRLELVPHVEDVVLELFHPAFVGGKHLLHLLGGRTGLTEGSPPAG